MYYERHVVARIFLREFALAIGEVEEASKVSQIALLKQLAYIVEHRPEIRASKPLDLRGLEV